MGRKGRSKPRWGLRLLALLLLVAVVGGAYAYWRFVHWTPERTAFPAQGAEIGEGDGWINLGSLKAVGADFVYLDASRGADRRDPSFARNYDAARAAGLRYGAVHSFDPCTPAERQAANFVTVVPRDGDLLPPAVALEDGAEVCEVRISDAAVESELMTLLNQIESHTGQPAILKLSPAFAAKHPQVAMIERNLWLMGEYVPPDYAGRPFTLWTANTMLQTEASEDALRWVVARP